MFEEEKRYYCEKCRRTLKGTEFYGSKNLEKYPNDGKLNQCKKCLTMHVDNWDPESYLWILKECDVPYIPTEWKKLMATYAKDNSKVNGMTIIGRYLSKMKLKQWKDYKWDDTAFLQELENNKIEETMKRQGYSAQEIHETLEKGSLDMPEKIEMPTEMTETSGPTYLETRYSEEEAFDLGLSEEDIRYLRLKWGKTYKPEEWVQLEQLYNDMMNSYDIQTAGHIDTLKLICKTSLKANQLIDLGDIDGYQKASKVYNELMKSGKFTAQQNKAESGEYVDSISELVAICETKGFIPRYYTDGPQDKVDRVLEDLQRYTSTLVRDEMGLGGLIENAIKQLEQERANDIDEEDFDEDKKFEEDLFNYDKSIALSDEDFEDFSEMQQDLANEDNDFLSSLLDGEYNGIE